MGRDCAVQGAVKAAPPASPAGLALCHPAVLHASKLACFVYRSAPAAVHCSNAWLVTWGMTRSDESGMPGSAAMLSMTVLVSTAITPTGTPPSRARPVTTVRAQPACSRQQSKRVSLDIVVWAGRAGRSTEQAHSWHGRCSAAAAYGWNPDTAGIEHRCPAISVSQPRRPRPPTCASIQLPRSNSPLRQEWSLGEWPDAQGSSTPAMAARGSSFSPVVARGASMGQHSTQVQEAKA